MPGPAGYASAPVPLRIPPPGPSFLRLQELTIGDRTLYAGISRPSAGPDDWWLAVLWVQDEHDVVSFEDVAPAGGPPPEPPALHLGSAMVGALSGLVREEGGRYAVRLSPVVPSDEPARPWRTPLAVRVAFGWEPARAAAMRPNELAAEVLSAFRRSVLGLRRP